MPGLTQRNLSFDLALEAATAALETARSRGFRVGVAVADRAGPLLVLLQDDGGGVHILDGARRKAFTAVSAHNRTSVLSKAVDVRSGEPDPHLVFLENVLWSAAACRSRQVTRSSARSVCPVLPDQFTTRNVPKPELPKSGRA